MNDLAQKLLSLPNIATAPACKQEDIISRLALLQTCQFTPPPLEYLQLLTHINGIRSFDTTLYGCYEKSNEDFTDFLDKNLLLDRTDKKYIIALGENMMDYLTYNHKEKIYETRDMNTDQITYIFNNLKDALSYFFDLNEE